MGEHAPADARADAREGTVSSSRFAGDGACEAGSGPLHGRPLLVVSVLDGAMRHASVRRCLRAALSALEATRDEGISFLDRRGRIGSVSETAGRILRESIEMPTAILPARIADWHARACGTLVIASDGSTLVVEGTEGGSALVLRERSSCEETLTARERDVMRCVEDGMSNAEIARELWIQPATVRKHLEHVFEKLEVRSRTAALSKLRGSRAAAN